MSERKSLSKKLRFEVFKRDRFTCQYCGRMSPDVILEVDHIEPVAEGGDDDILNLITACRDCNRGKGKVRLSDNESVKKQQQQLRDLADTTEQTQMMIQWKKELLEMRKQEVDSICDLIGDLAGLEPNESDRRDIQRYLTRFSFSDVWDATEISFMRYFDERGSDYQVSKSYNFALRKIGGICYNRNKAGEDDGNI